MPNIQYPTTRDRPHLYLPGELHDARGVPIYPGDLLRTFHFRDRRKRQYYLYHVAVWRKQGCLWGMAMVPTTHLDQALAVHPETRNGDPVLSPELAAEATVIDGTSVGEWLLFTDRPRRKPVAVETEVNQ